MGIRALVHTFAAAVHASKSFVHLTRGCILPTRKMFLDLSWRYALQITFRQPEKYSQTYPGFALFVGHTLPTGRMFLDLSWLYLSPQPHSVSLKNVHRPIRSSLPTR